MSSSKTVFVGLSGGVDSGVAAALLKQEGYQVVGVYMKNWSRDIAGHHCPWREDLTSARSVAAHLQIEFKIYDFEKEYFEAVTSYMIDTYKKGLTPNPDVMCNQKIKFDTFYNKCISEGADYVATGHYAVMHDGRLQTAKDKSKDQTYFLYSTNPDIAKNIIFPLGKYLKSAVRSLAKDFGLPNYNRPDSQGLCFVGNIPLRDFLSEFIKPQKGKIKTDQGDIVGEHSGAFAYTIGQRHGLGIGGGKPYFVYKIDTKSNTVFVTADENSKLLNKSEFEISQCHWWQSVDDYKNNLEVRVRYRSNTIGCKLNKINNDSYKVMLDKSERAIAPGQSAVLYSDDIVVGGGIIK